MLPFYVLIFVPLFIQHIKIKGIDYQKKNKLALGVFFVILLFLLMFRSPSVGNDTVNYMNIFKSISWHGHSGVEGFSDERGFVTYTWLVSLITENPQVYIAISAVLVVIMMIPTYMRLCEDSILTILMFCSFSTFVMMFSGIRQMLVISVGFLVYYFVRNRKIIPYLLLSYGAILLHTSAVMLFFMYPLYHAKITRKWLWAVIPIVIMIFIFNEQIFTIIGVYIDEYTRFDSTIEETGSYMMIVLFIVLGIFSFVIPEEESLDKETSGLRNFLLFATVIQLFAPLHTLAMRLGYYYIIFIPLLVPKIIKCRAQKWAQVVIVSRYLMVIVFMIYFFYMMHTTQPLNVVPYSFCWEAVH